MTEREKHPNAQGDGFNRAKFITQPAPDHKIPDGPMDPADACKTLKEKGGVHPSERKRVHTATGY